MMSLALVGFGTAGICLRRRCFSFSSVCTAAGLCCLVAHWDSAESPGHSFKRISASHRRPTAGSELVNSRLSLLLQIDQQPLIILASHERVEVGILLQLLD